MQEVAEKRMKVKKGWLTVKVGNLDGGDGYQSFTIPISYLYHPLFSRLLESAGEVYGFRSSGPLKLPCSVDDFLRLRWFIERDKCSQLTITLDDLALEVKKKGSRQLPPPAFFFFLTTGRQLSSLPRSVSAHAFSELRASLPKPALVGGVSRVEEDEENIDPAFRCACTADHALFSGTTVLNTSGGRVAEDPLANDVFFLHVTAAVAAILISFRLFAIVILSFLCALIIVLTTQLLGDILCVVPRPGVLQPPASQVPAASCFPSAGTPAGIQLQLISSASANLTALFISAYPLQINY
ncbi:hypothetical protein ZIOFF_038262 [Zingiber officinale]|uniref:Uncharacterized protein n=1 Tax=Zingiber officinale TaxID=94328 RepID=A0A8J5GEC1_ZINOF|nr:hypothetical protein ZIOFF_038262 [Zingiber officinale]